MFVFLLSFFSSLLFLSATFSHRYFFSSHCYYFFSSHCYYFFSSHCYYFFSSHCYYFFFILLLLLFFIPLLLIMKRRNSRQLKLRYASRDVSSSSENERRRNHPSQTQEQHSQLTT